MLSESLHAEQKAENRVMLKIILSSICYLGIDKALLCVVITRLWMSQEREVSLIQTSYSYCEHELKII